MLENDNSLVLDEYKSSFYTYEVSPGLYTFKDFSEVLLSSLQPEYEGYHNAIDINFDDITIKTKLIVGPSIVAIGFD